MRKTRQALVDPGSLIERILIGQNFQTFSNVLSPRTHAPKTGEATRERYWGVPVFICLQTNKREISRLREHQTMQETLVWYIPEVDEPPKDGYHCSTHSEHHRGILSLPACEHVEAGEQSTEICHQAGADNRHIYPPIPQTLPPNGSDHPPTVRTRLEPLCGCVYSHTINHAIVCSMDMWIITNSHREGAYSVTMEMVGVVLDTQHMANPRQGKQRGARQSNR